MAGRKRWYLVTYDVRDPKRLRRVAKALEGHGVRLQYSVFQCRLSERGMERLRWELTKLVDKDDDLLVIGLCPACAEALWRERATTDQKAGSSYEII